MPSSYQGMCAIYTLAQVHVLHSYSYIRIDRTYKQGPVTGPIATSYNYSYVTIMILGYMMYQLS